MHGHAQIRNRKPLARLGGKRRRPANPVKRYRELLQIVFAHFGLIGARIAAHEFPLPIENFERHRPARGLSEEIVNHGAVRRIFGRRLVRRNRCVRIRIPTHTHRRSGLEEQRVRLRRLGDLPQPRDIVEHREPAPVRRHDQVVVVNPKVAHGGVRQI